MRFFFSIIIISLCFIFGAKAQEVKQVQDIDVNTLKARAAQILRQYEEELHTEVLQEFDNMDVNFDGYIGEGEFIDASTYGTAEQRSMVFQAMDGNHDGILSKDEMWFFVKSRIDAL